MITMMMMLMFTTLHVMFVIALFLSGISKVSDYVPVSDGEYSLRIITEFEAETGNIFPHNCFIIVIAGLLNMEMRHRL